MSNKVLDLQFLTSDGKTRSLKVNTARENLDPLTVSEAMDQIINANAFSVDTMPIYAARKGARYIENIVTPIFEEE